MAFTQKQLELIKDALGDDKDWPKFTIDPMVNYEIDRRVLQKTKLWKEWKELSTAAQEIYKAEAEYYKNSLEKLI